jgi:hypothetical protein
MNLEVLKDKLSKCDLPKSIQLDDCTHIADVELMISSHIATLERNAGNITFMPYYERLVRLFEILSL